MGPGGMILILIKHVFILSATLTESLLKSSWTQNCQWKITIFAMKMLFPAKIAFNVGSIKYLWKYYIFMFMFSPYLRVFQTKSKVGRLHSLQQLKQTLPCASVHIWNESDNSKLRDCLLNKGYVTYHKSFLFELVILESVEGPFKYSWFMTKLRVTGLPHIKQKHSVAVHFAYCLLGFGLEG